MEPHPDEQFHPGDEELNWSEQHENLKGNIICNLYTCTSNIYLIKLKVKFQSS